MKMTKVSLLKTSIVCAQGNLDQTLQAIKNSKIVISSKEVATMEEKIKIPYFLLEKETQENEESISKAIKDVVIDVISDLDESDKKQTALIVGTALIDLNTTESITEIIDEQKVYSSMGIKRSIDSYAKDIANELGLNEFTMTIGTACTSSANAVLEAKNLLDAGVFKYVVVVGVEIFSEMMSSGFSSMKLLSSSSQKPFDTNREGIVLGEGLASILIGKDKSPWSLISGFSNCDSATITSVSESGDEFAKVIKNSLAVSALSPKDITALKAHATSTTTNDIAEINAIKTVFNEDIVFTALKPYLGHTLGACGVLELAVFMASIDEGFIPKTLGHKDSIYKNYVPLLEHKKCTNGIFMLNYFGFGGSNTSLIIKKEAS
jgi:3-oxoacyl-[acyl-carrier-protein] synthase I